MSSSDDDVLILIAAALLLKKKQNLKKQKKRLWMKNVSKRRNNVTHEHILKELNVSSTENVRNFLRMDSETFDEILSMIQPFIQKKDTAMREAIPPNMRLAATLRYLATGHNFAELQHTTAISIKSLGKIVIETCTVITKCLSKYIKLPYSETGWKQIADDFQIATNFPNCMGVIDGRHIAIKKPKDNESIYYNYNSNYSIVLMGIINANYEFIACDVSTNGSISDGDIIEKTKFGKALYNQFEEIPEPAQLPNSSKIAPHVFVANNAFELQENLLKPYAGRSLKIKERNFNFRLNRAQRIAENVFGILLSRFSVLQTTITLSPEKVQKIVLACCYLHNFLLKKGIYKFPDSIDREDSTTGDIVEGTWRHNIDMVELQSKQITNSSHEAKEIRDIFATYFMEEGKIPAQAKIVK